MGVLLLLARPFHGHWRGLLLLLGLFLFAIGFLLSFGHGVILLYEVYGMYGAVLS